MQYLKAFLFEFGTKLLDGLNQILAFPIYAHTIAPMQQLSSIDHSYSFIQVDCYLYSLVHSIMSHVQNIYKGILINCFAGIRD
jgi:hypothetical protein